MISETALKVLEITSGAVTLGSFALKQAVKKAKLERHDELLRAKWEEEQKKIHESEDKEPEETDAE